MGRGSMAGAERSGRVMVSQNTIMMIERMVEMARV